MHNSEGCHIWQDANQYEEKWNFTISSQIVSDDNQLNSSDSRTIWALVWDSNVMPMTAMPILLEWSSIQGSFFLFFNLVIYPLVHRTLLNGLRVLPGVIFRDHFSYTTIPLCYALVFHKLVFSRTCSKNIIFFSQMLPSKWLLRSNFVKTINYVA